MFATRPLKRRHLVEDIGHCVGGGEEGPMMAMVAMWLLFQTRPDVLLALLPRAVRRRRPRSGGRDQCKVR
jgi:hypothetical protein